MNKYELTLRTISSSMDTFFELLTCRARTQAERTKAEDEYIRLGELLCDLGDRRGHYEPAINAGRLVLQDLHDPEEDKKHPAWYDVPPEFHLVEA